MGTALIQVTEDMATTTTMGKGTTAAVQIPPILTRPIRVTPTHMPRAAAVQVMPTGSMDIGTTTILPTRPWLQHRLRRLG